MFVSATSARRRRRFSRAAVVIAPGLALGLAVGAAPPAQAAITIGVAPSPNGLVMVGVPTSIAATGFKGTAKVYRFDATSKKWSMLGTVSSGKALPYTFQNPGATKLKVVPRAGAAKTAVVGVYGKFAAGSSTPTSYGSVVLPSSTSYGSSASAPAAKGCAFVDIGGKAPISEHPFMIQVLSTGAPEFTLQVPGAAGSAAVGVPVKGDVVVNNNRTYGNDLVGIVWTCLSEP
jgi:hypothetical protein